MTRAVVGAACAVVSAGLWGVLAAQRAAHVRDVSRQPWRKVLGTGWPWSPAHGVIRVGHAMRRCWSMATGEVGACVADLQAIRLPCPYR
jgi:hypothetical protein